MHVPACVWRFDAGTMQSGLSGSFLSTSEPVKEQQGDQTLQKLHSQVGKTLFLYTVRHKLVL